MALNPQEMGSITVIELQQLEFSQLPLNEKIIIKKRGRSTPDLQISQPGVSNNKKYIRSFNSEWYLRKSWLCGCEIKNALFCFPCLLFGGDVTWTKNGFRNINKTKEKTEKHEKSKGHIDNVISLTLLGTISVTEKVSEAYKLSMNEHNLKVKKNREILSKVIDCILFCGNFEPSFRKQNEKVDSMYPGVFKHLLHFASRLDSDLKNHLETSLVFKNMFASIESEILDCLLRIYREEIKEEIRKASYVAVMVDDTTDVCENAQMVLVLRYVLNEEIFERFWGFFNPENPTADGISKNILEQLHVILEGNGQKLVGQTFDSANVFKGKKVGIPAKIKAVYGNAHYIHCYAQQPDRIVRNAASITRNARMFFCNILTIQSFFSKSSHRSSILKKYLEIGVLDLFFANRNIDGFISQIYDYFEPLKKSIFEIQSTSNTDETITESTALLKCLTEDNFKFWLNIFYRIMPHVKKICNQMQLSIINMVSVNEHMTNFKKTILEISNKEYFENPSDGLAAEVMEVCDSICDDIVDRYSFIEHLLAAKLLDKKYFSIFNKEPPTEEIVLTTEAYPMINKEKLETELKVFYSRSDIHGYENLIQLLKFISDNNLNVVLSEITELVKLLLTLPMTTPEKDRYFLTFDKIKNFLKTFTNCEKLNELAVPSVEKNFLDSHPNMKEKIIDLFAQNENRKKDFLFN